jgi:hypothetical protein
MEKHITEEKKVIIHQDAIDPGLSLATFLLSRLLCLLHSEGVALDLRRRSVRVTDFSRRGGEAKTAGDPGIDVMIFSLLAKTGACMCGLGAKGTWAHAPKCFLIAK